MQHAQEEIKIFNDVRQGFIVNGDLCYAGKLLDRAYRLYSGQIALIAAHKSITYKEFYFRALLLSNALRSQGVKPRDRVILYYENSLEFYIAYFAVWHIGAIIVPINTFLHEKELTHIVQDSAPVLVIASPTLKQNIEPLISCMLLSEDVFDWQSEVPADLEPLVTQTALYDLAIDELCALLYTSGTTGVPRGVMLSSRNIMTNALQGYARFTAYGMTHDDRFFCVLPLFHVFAQNTCLWLPIMAGSSVVIVSKIDRKLIFEGLQKRPTIFLGFPALYGLLCLMKNAPLDSIKMFVSGADMLPDKIRAIFSIIYGRKICSGYGLSEAAPVIAVNCENAQQATHVVGAPLTGIVCQIRDDEGKVQPTGSIGTLWVKGDNVMMGYYNAPEATALIVVDGWLNTGDIASLDQAGRLAIHGRIKDVIIHKGFNIYPAEVENVLMSHPAVFKAAVIGHEDSASGQVPVAFVAVRALDGELEKNLRNLCSHNLAAYKVPRKIICLEDLPMNATGKVDKKKLPRTHAGL